MTVIINWVVEIMNRIDIKKIKKYKFKKKTMLGAVVLSGMMALNIGVAFADVDINALLNGWYSKKTELAKSDIDKAVKAETEIQKERIAKEVRAKMDTSSQDLNKFTEDEKNKRVQAVIDYANNIINNINVSGDAEKKQLKDKLDAIENNAKAEMDNVKASTITSSPNQTSTSVGR